MPFFEFLPSALKIIKNNPETNSFIFIYHANPSLMSFFFVSVTTFTVWTEQTHIIFYLCNKNCAFIHFSKFDILI